MPTVSIIIPTYNRASYLGEAIDSVLRQAYTDYEIIIIDDGSTDDTAQRVREYQLKHSQILYISQENRGRAAARNKGLAAAKGKYIAFLDSDDLFLPDKLEIMIGGLEKHREYGMAYSSALCFEKNGEIPCRYNHQGESGDLYQKIAFWLPLTLTTPTVVIRSEILGKTGNFDENMERFEDTDMWRRAAKHYPVLGFEKALSKIRVHPDNILRYQDPEKIFRQLTFYVKKVFKEDRHTSWQFRLKGAARFYYYYGSSILQILPWQRIGRKFITASLKYWPFRLEAFGQYLKSIKHSYFTTKKKKKAKQLFFEATAYLQEGEIDKARQRYRELSEGKTTGKKLKYRACLQLGNLLQKENNDHYKILYRQAIDLLNAVKFKSPLERYHLASANKQLERLDPARDQFHNLLHTLEKRQKAAGLRGKIHFHLAEIALVRHQLTAAREHLQRCLALDPAHCRAKTLLNELVIEREK